MDWNRPLTFAPNRVWRCYTGGLLLDRFVGGALPVDSHFPEDWLASTVSALNGEHSQGSEEGLARLLNDSDKPAQTLSSALGEHGAEILGQAHAARYGEGLGVLCKYLDSAVRLPIQCHPDRPTARRLYGSEFGKTECWHILDTRRIRDETPYLLMGFRAGATPDAFAKAVREQDIPALEAMLHRITPKAGETYFVPARLPHAIGPGVFMLEVQEPSDWVVQPERYCADTRLSDKDMWGPLEVEQGLGVFDCTPCDRATLLDRVLAEEVVLREEKGGVLLEVIGETRTDAFAVQRARVRGKMRIKPARSFAVVVVAEGSGSMTWGDGQRPLRRGDYFLQPAGVEWIEYDAHEALSLVFCLPPRA
jgi:mannose-6-phosphate isomerase